MNTQFKALLTVCECCLVSVMLTGCLPDTNIKPDQQLNIVELDNESHNIDYIQPISFTVDSTKTWQNSRVFIQRGDKVTIKAHGRWSAWPEAGIWSGPEGTILIVGEYGTATGNSLIARLGYKGAAFEVGPTRTFKANEYGMLYMAINDNFNYLYNNQGKVNADIYIDKNKSLKSSDSEAESSHKITAFSYDDATGKGSISATVGTDVFGVRQWLLEKIGEISSSKNIAIDASKNRSDGGAYRVMDEKIEQQGSVLTIWFETLF